MIILQAQPRPAPVLKQETASFTSSQPMDSDEWNTSIQDKQNTSTINWAQGIRLSDQPKFEELLDSIFVQETEHIPNDNTGIGHILRKTSNVLLGTDADLGDVEMPNDECPTRPSDTEPSLPRSTVKRTWDDHVKGLPCEAYTPL